MTTAGKKSRAFVIGDRELGLIIVVTNPVMVVHYAGDDWKFAQRMNKTGTEDPETLRAAIVQDVVTALRGVDVDALQSTQEDIRENPDSYSQPAKEAVFAEVDHARTIARLIRQGTAIVDVDFCLAFDVDSSNVANRPRSSNPVHKIKEYLRAHKGSADPGETTSTTPQVFEISGVDIDGSTSLPPWEDPDAPKSAT